MGDLLDKFHDLLTRHQMQTREDDKYCQLCRYRHLQGCQTSSPYFCPSVQAQVNVVEGDIWATRIQRHEDWIKEDL